jgi:choline dehydrogenase
MPSRREFVRDSARLLGAAMLPGMVSSQDRPAEFDYVIVGAGASGCVLANRLSADENVQVLLVEAGGPDTHPLIQIPGRWTSLLESEVDWNYATEPHAVLGGRSIKWPRGKTYGGSSAIGAMAYVRGHRLCYDEWAASAGSIWSFEESLPVFKQLEDNSRGSSEFTGTGGSIPVSDTSDPNRGHEAFLEAAREVGFDASPTWDFNGARQEQAAGFYQKNIRNGRRHSAAAAFLTPVRSRSNLTTWPHASVRRVTMSGSTATGVELSLSGEPRRVRAIRGVVLAAGVIESPKILMLSGVGPAGVLRRLGLPVVADLRGVGSNLHDHPRVPVRWSAREPLAPSSVSAGLFTFSRTNEGRSQRPPDLQFYVGRGLDSTDPFITLTVVLTVPRSRGTVTLRSADPTVSPVIQPNYLVEPADLDALVEGVRLARSLATTRAYAAIRGAAVDPPDELRTADELRSYIRRTTDTIFHPVGTCRMGTGADAVVDGRLRVHGIDNLSVADASVMPSGVNSQTLAACLLIGDRAARFVTGR